MNFKNKIDELKDLESELINIRRHIHKHPETSLKEVETSKFIVEKLKEFGISEIYDDFYETSVMALIKGKEKGKTILIRSDMDALHITEETNLDFKSINEGVMHGCGHDAHVTWLLGVAYILNKYKNSLKGTYKLIFQPAEEDVGGADELLKRKDILEMEPKVDFAIAGHVWPEINSGSYGLVNGCAMASANKFELDIIGKGGHGAEPHKTIDPIALASAVYMTSQQILSRRANPFSNSVLTIGVFEGKGAFNVIPDQVHMEGTVRGESYEEVCRITSELDKITEGIVKAQGGDYSLKIEKPILPVINDANLVIASEKIFKDINEDLKVLKHGAMTGEDFCYFSNRVPSLFFYVGTRKEEKGITYPLHSSKFTIDETILFNTSIIFATIATELLD